MNEIEEQLDDSLLQLVLFRLSGEIYAINVLQVQEILRITDIAPVPGAPHDIIGIINLRGNVVTVIDARIRFGLVATELDYDSRIIIVESKGEMIGMLVDSVAEVVDLHASTIESTPKVNSDDSSRYIQGVSNHDGALIILVNLKTFLSEDDVAELEMF